MYLNDKRPTFREVKPKSNPYRVLILLVFIVAGYYLYQGIEVRQDIKPLFLPTSTPTRTANSYASEGETYFVAGDLVKAIDAYRKGIELEPNNPQVLAELARIQTYSSNLLTTDSERKTRLQEAQQSIDQALKMAPDDSTVHAVRAFVLDWNANPIFSGDNAREYLAEAEKEAIQALQLDNQNTLALAYYAEVLVDQQKWLQAEQYIKQAVAQDPSLMDVHRVNAYVMESLGDYNGAITEYQKAAEITPNLTFLYISIGVNYRQLQVYDKALDAFAKAVTINKQLGINDPIPYLSIAKTYSQQGEFFIAAQNIKKAMELDPSNADVYGQLGVIYQKSRNYEGSLPAFKCAIYGCNAQESCDVRNCDATERGVEVQGMDLSPNTLVYYYTYGSILAALHRPGDDYCTQAAPVFMKVRSQYENDPNVMSIVEAGEEICSNITQPTGTATPQLTITPSP